MFLIVKFVFFSRGKDIMRSGLRIFNSELEMLKFYKSFAFFYKNNDLVNDFFIFNKLFL
jgi:hypothetical protein